MSVPCHVIPPVHSLTVKTFSAITLHFTTVLFLEGPAVFCIALELVSQLSFCVNCQAVFL